MSQSRRPLCVAILAIVLGLGCRELPGNPWDELPADAARLAVTPARDSAFLRALGTLPVVTGMPQRVGRIIRDSLTWRAAWDSVFARALSGASPPLPAVEFSREMVVLVSGGQREYGGRVGINGVFEGTGGLFVLVLDGFPEARCSVPRQPGEDARLPTPVAIALVPRREASAQYLNRSGSLRCP